MKRGADSGHTLRLPEAHPLLRTNLASMPMAPASIPDYCEQYAEEKLPDLIYNFSGTDSYNTCHARHL